MNTTIFNENLNSFAIKLINSSFDNYDNNYNDNYDFTSRSNYFNHNIFSKLCVEIVGTEETQETQETEDNNDVNNFIYDVLVISKLYAIIYNLYVNKNTDDKSFENFIKNVKIKLITSSENPLITSQIISENIVQIVDLFNINNLKLNSNITKNNYHTLYNIKDFTADIYKKNIINNIPIPLYHKFNKHEDNFTPFIGLSNFVIDSNINKITVTNESIYTYEITNTGSVNINIKFHNTDEYLTDNEIKKLYETYKNNILTSKNIDTYKYTRILLYIDAFNNILNTNYKSILSTLKYYMYYYNAVIYNINIQYLILKNQNDRIIKINKTELINNINNTITTNGYIIENINNTINNYFEFIINIINNDGYNINYKSEIIDTYKYNIKSSINTYITDNKLSIISYNKLNKLKCYMPTIIVDDKSSLKTISLNNLKNLISDIHTDNSLSNYFNWGNNLNNLISYYETYLIKVYSYENSIINESINTTKLNSIFNCNIIKTILPNLSDFITNDNIDIIKNLNFDTDKDKVKKFVNSLNNNIRTTINDNSITITDTQNNYPNIFNKFIDNLYISYCILQIKYSNDYYTKNYNDNYNYIDGLYTKINTIIQFINNNLNMLLNVNIPTFNDGITTFKDFLLNKIDELYIDIIKGIKNDINFKSNLDTIIKDIIPVDIDTAKINNEINDSINNYNTIINTTNDIISTISKFDNSFKDKYARFKDNDNYYYEDQKKLNTTINNYNEELKKYTDMLWYYRKNVIFGFLLIMVIILIFNINVNDNIKIIIYICILLILFLVYYLNTIIVEEKFTVCLNKDVLDTGTGTFKPDISYNNYYVILKQYLYYIDYLSGIKYKDDVYKNTKINDYILQLTIHRQKEQEIYKLKNINLENAIEIFKKTINIYYFYNTSIIFNIIILIISIILYILFPNIKKFIIITIVVFIIISIYYIQFNIHKRTRMNENKYYWSYLNPSKMTLHSIL